MRKICQNLQEFQTENMHSQNPFPFHDGLDVLKESVTVGTKIAPNRLACQAMEGCDGKPDGSPDELTLRRYRRFAEGGAGVIWFEATACREDGRANPRQLWLHEKNLDCFKRTVEEIKENAVKAHGHEPLVIMQNTHSGRYSKPHGFPEPLIAYQNPLFEKDKPIDEARILSDDEIDRIKEALVASSHLAEEVGFDGVDIKCCHRYLNSELLSAYNRAGKYGGSFENRTRLLRESIADSIQNCSKDFIVTSRLNVYDGFPYPYGFGVAPDGTTDLALEEPILLLRELARLGVRLLNITMGNPYVNPHVNRPFAMGGYTPEEEPLDGVRRMLFGTATLKKEVPEIQLICSGLSYLGMAAPHVAAGMIAEGDFDFAGFGRTIFAYPDFARDILENGCLKKEKLCICCSKCTELMRAGGTPGCVIRDPLYTALYTESRKGAK